MSCSPNELDLRSLKPKMRSNFKFIAIVLFIGTAILACSSHSESQLDLRGKVKRLVLDNGMTFLLLKRDGAPTFSSQLVVKVGSIEEEPGESGLAHFFEHMAFKGTNKIGTQDFAKEKPILDEVLKVGTEIARMKKAGKKPGEYAGLQKKLRELETKENTYTVKNEFFNILQKNGAHDLNAATSADFTMYYTSLPANKLELWAYLESERLLHRVPREFFTEVDVVHEERRMSVDNTPEGRLFEAYLAAGFRVSPYRILTVGKAEDIQSYTPAAAQKFFDRYYIPARMVGVLVGNFNIAEAKDIIHRYFDKIPTRKDTAGLFAAEKFVPGEVRRVIVDEEVPPRFYLGYHRPAYPHADDIVFDVVQSLLCEGETARLHRKIVIEDSLAEAVDCYATFPGERLDSLFTFDALPLGSHTNSEVHEAIRREINRLATFGPSDEELIVVKNRIDAEIIYAMQTNSGLAELLGYFETLTGGWEYLYELQEKTHKVTRDDVKRVLKTYFVSEREVSAYLE